MQDLAWYPAEEAKGVHMTAQPGRLVHLSRELQIHGPRPTQGHNEGIQPPLTTVRQSPQAAHSSRLGRAVVTCPQRVQRTPIGRLSMTSAAPAHRGVYNLPTTWASTWDIWSWGLNSTILTASSTTTVWPEGQ